MPLIKQGKLTDDTFVTIGPEDEVPAGDVIVPLPTWQAERDDLIARDSKVGVQLASHEHPEAIAGDLEHLSVVALEFPSFADGRAYSYARLLRDAMGFSGELRAVGDVLLEQLAYMQRIGFDAFNVSDPDAVAAWETAAADFTVWYQPTNDGRSSVIQKRQS